MYLEDLDFLEVNKMENLSELKRIGDIHPKTLWTEYVANLKKAYTHDWIFSRYEKLIVLGAILWLIYSIGRALWPLF